MKKPISLRNSSLPEPILTLLLFSDELVATLLIFSNFQGNPSYAELSYNGKEIQKIVAKYVLVSWIDIIACKELALNIAEQGLIPGSAQNPPLEY